MLQSKELPLCSDEFADEAAGQLKEILKKDDSPAVREALKSDFAKGLGAFNGWFQRIDFPEHNITSTSDHSLINHPGDVINTLGGRLSLDESAIIRPIAKWLYLEPLLPDIKGKTVLEVGSNNGFFSFRFAEMGAESVTGVEVVKRYFDPAVWARDILGTGNVEFLNSDIMLDLTIPRHDIVFMSAVHIHFVTFFYGLLRSINLSKELVIIDSGGAHSDPYGLRFHIGRDKKTQKIQYHAWHASRQLMEDFLGFIGVEPSRITYYTAPWGNHGVYFIDTSNVDKHRKEMGYPVYIESFLDLNFKTPCARGGDKRLRRKGQRVSAFDSKL